MDLNGSIGIQSEFWEGEGIAVLVFELPGCQIQLTFAFKFDDDDLGLQSTCANYTADLHGDVGLQLGAGCRHRVTAAGGSHLLDHGRLADGAIIAVVPEQDSTRHARRDEDVQQQVLDEFTAIHRARIIAQKSCRLQVECYFVMEMATQSFI